MSVQSDPYGPVPSAATVRDAGADAAVMKALADHKQRGLLLAVKARWTALAVIAVLIIFVNRSWAVLYYEALLVGFALIGWAQLKVGRVGRSRPELLLMFCDLALMTFTFVVPNPLEPREFPLAMQFHFGGFFYYFVLLGGATLAYSWRTVVAMGIWTAILWTLAILWAMWQPARFPELTQRITEALGEHAYLADFVDPNSFQITIRVQEVVVFLIVAGMLAVAGWRSSRLLLHHAGVERERTNLARYFSPNVVEQLARNDEPLKRVRSQDVAVLFVDIVGFTAFSEARPPDDVVATLRDFFSRMEANVFRNSGTLDKYLGDGLMATFGTPVPGARDAHNALCCTGQMVRDVAVWNAERRARGEEPLTVGFGLHYGKAVLGDIGSNRLEFAVIGSTVNIASRLEKLTRPLDAAIVASNAVIDRVLAETAGTADLAGFERRAPQAIRGLSEPVDIWVLPVDAAPKV